MNIPKLDLPRVVIIGGGFAGLKMARLLDTSKLQVVLFDKNNYHTFQPLMYQVATAGLEPDSIAHPLRKILKKKKHTHIRMAEVRAIDATQKQLQTSIGTLAYDYLIVATGAQTNFFGNQNIEKNAMPMKTLTESLDLRSMILQKFEKALTETDITEQDALMNFTIVGGGPTGVELAGALSELRAHVLPKDYPDLDIRRMQINLIEASEHVLNAMSQKSSTNATKYLKKMGINVWTDTYVKDYKNNIVTTSKDQYQSHTLIWAAGVKGSFPKGLEAATIEKGRICVDEFGWVEGLEDIAAIGDTAILKTETHPNGLPMLASVAQQQGKHLAKNFKRLSLGKALVPFNYKDKGTMATVGRNKAVVDLGKRKFGGFLAWLTWMFVHLMLLVDFRSRMVVFINWVWSYINFDRGTRLIVRKFKREQV